MCWEMFSAAGECKCLSEPPAAACSSFPASIAQSACNFHARKYSCHTAKWVKQFLEAKNTEIMIWPAQSLDLNPIEKSLENSWWQSYGYETHYSHQTMEETGRRVDQDHTRAVWETSDVLQPQMCWSHSKHWPVHFLLISDCCNFRNFSSSCYNHCCSLILITVFSTK